MEMHKARKSIQQVCPVCGAFKNMQCQQATKNIPGKQDEQSIQKILFGYDTKEDYERSLDEKDEAAKFAWAEFQVLNAVHNLKELNPNHALVVLVETFLENAQELYENGQLELHLEEVKPN